jgi:hypothetical protein
MDDGVHLDEALVEVFVGQVVEGLLQQRVLRVPHQREELRQRDLRAVDHATVGVCAAGYRASVVISIL